jgi:hypothetical protein
MRWLEELWSDVGHTLRTVRTSPGFAIVMVGSIGIGVGANAVARLGGRALLALAATGPAPIPLDLPTDWRIVGFLAALSVMTGLLFGLAPAMRLARTDLFEIMKSAGERQQ